MQIIQHPSPNDSTIHAVALNNGSLERSCVVKEESLKNTLFATLYPEGRLACLSVASPRMRTFEAISSGVMYQGVRYMPIGSRKSAAQGELYLVDENTAVAIAERFGNCGEALISYFDVLITPCTRISREPAMRVTFINREMPGTFHWRGCVKKSVAERLGLAGGTFHQIVMAFAGTQVRGELAVTDDHLVEGEFFGADLVLPTRASKPFPSPVVTLLARTLEGPATVGITDAPTEGPMTGCEMLLARIQEHVCSAACNVPIADALRALVEQRLVEKRLQAFTMQKAVQFPKRVVV